MKPYNVHFSYYSKENGQFEGTKYTLEAENQFEARQKAWDLFDNDKEMKNASCVSQCGVTWKASILDLQDYFNMLASIDKCTIRQIENIDIPNNKLHQDEARVTSAKAAIRECWGSLDAISNIAEDMGRPFGMKPPSIYEELHYSELFARELEKNGQEKEAASLYNRISAAEKWDEDAIYSLDKLFHDGDVWLNGGDVYLSDYFARDSVFPEKADLSDTVDDYMPHRLNTLTNRDIINAIDEAEDAQEDEIF